MSAAPPKIRLSQNQLCDLFGTPMILASAERARDGHRLIGDEFVFDRWFTSGDGKRDELAATTIESHVHGAKLPPHSRHRPIERSEFDYVMQHVALSHTKTGIICQLVCRVNRALQSCSVEDDRREDEPRRIVMSKPNSTARVGLLDLLPRDSDFDDQRKQRVDPRRATCSAKG